MSGFSAILEDSLRAAEGLGLAPLALAPRFAGAVEGRGGLRLATLRLKAGDAGEIRSARVESPKVEVLNLFFFPDPARDLPLYVLELVALAGRPLVAVLDAPRLGAGCAGLEEEWAGQRRRAGLPQAEEVPGWYAACRSGFDFFVRPRGAEDIGRLAEAHAALWRGQVRRMAAAGALPEDRREDRARLLAAYKRHHAAHAPGLPLLGRGFGEEWAACYFAEALFA